VAAGVIAAGGLLGGCGVWATSTELATPKDTAGYRVLTGAVRLPLAGIGQSATPFERFSSGGPQTSPEVPSAKGRWFITSSTTAQFRRSARVELLATGDRGVRFNLFWEETCGGTRVGRHGVAGGSGGEADLTLHSPALVAVKLPARYGSYDRCYLAATVSMHTQGWKAAKSASPAIKIIHY
jgi:hypothetical protein